MNVRFPAVAGTFYPDNPERLREMVQVFLKTAVSASSGQNVSSQTTIPSPKAIIAPHAGYMYSGPTAGSAYVHVASLAGKIERVIMLGPAHTMAFHGLATSSTHFFQTPLGEVPVDQEAVQKVLALPQVQILDAAHAREHGLEVHLPFLQETLGKFSLVPFVVGTATPEEVAEVIETLWGGSETLIVISSDLSHFLSYEQARILDKATCAAIENVQPEAVTRDGACGRLPIQGLLLLAKRRRMSVFTLDLRNSGDTAGSKNRVVGYGAWVFSNQYN